MPGSIKVLAGTSGSITESRSANLLAAISAFGRIPASSPAVGRGRGREPREPVHVDLGGGGDEVEPTQRLEAGGAAFTACLARIEAASRPLVVCGSWCLGNDDFAPLGSLALPVLTTPAAKGLVPETAAHAAGVLTGAGKALAPERALLAEADLVVGFGLRAGELIEPELGRPMLLFDDPQLLERREFPAARWRSPCVTRRPRSSPGRFGPCGSVPGARISSPPRAGA